jgi:hypothetical protein
VEVYRRLGEVGGDEWEVETYTHGDRVDLRSVELGLPIEAIYEDVIGTLGQ